MNQKDPYEVLEVSRSATDEEIKKAYRRLSKKYHPDLNRDNPQAEAKFKEINAAYEVLGDKQKRAQYDQYGSTFQGAGTGGFGFEGFESGFQGVPGGFSDIFESFFGGVPTGKRKKRSSKGQDLEVVLMIEFHEAIFGVDKVVTLNKDVMCENCAGKGVESDSTMIDCPKCKGTGEVSSIKNTILGQIRTSSLCPQCEGEGQIPEKPCRICHGNGVTRDSQPLTIRIPAGVSDGTTLRLSGKGAAGYRGQSSGDLYVQIRVKTSLEFVRKGDAIYSEKTIHVLQAILGDQIEVGTVHGLVVLEIPAGTQPNQTFRIREKGAPKLNATGKGDHYVTVHIEIPKRLSSEEKEHYRALAKQAKLSAKSQKGFFSGLFS